jgi:hypothetical protein
VSQAQKPGAFYCTIILELMTKNIVQLNDIGCRRLIGAVLLRAMKQAQKNDPYVVKWLLSDGPVYLEALGIDVNIEHFRAFVQAGCPGKLTFQGNQDD